MIPSVFSQFPAFAYRRTRCRARATWTPEPLLAKHLWATSWLWHSGGTAPLPPVSPSVGCGQQDQPCRAQSQPRACCLQGSGTKQIHLTGEGNYRRPLWGWAISEGKCCLSLRQSWLESESASGDAPTTAQLGMHLVFPRYQGETLCGIRAQQTLCCTCRYHTSEITGKIKTWKTTIKGELPGKRNGWLVFCMELQQVRKESLNGKSESHTFSYYKPDFCLWTHCYSICELFAPAVLFPLCTKWHKTSFITFARKLLPFLRIIYILK